MKPWSEAEVVLDFIPGYVIAWSGDGSWLGNWRATEVSAEKARSDRVLLFMGKEVISFYTKDPSGLVRAVERETQNLLAMTARERLVQATRVLTLRVRRRHNVFAKARATHPAIDSVEQAPGPDWGGFPPRSERVVPTKETGELQPVTEDTQAQRALLEALQRQVLDGIQYGMESWFGFYFAMGKGTGRQRIESAVAGLNGASERLKDMADRFGEAIESRPDIKELVGPYRDAVVGWAEGLRRLAQGVELDQDYLAQRGLDLLQEAAAVAEQSVVVHIGPGERSGVRESLAFLAGLRPPGRASLKAIREAKRPWKTAIISSGAPFRRS